MGTGILQENMKSLKFSPDVGKDMTTNRHPHRSTKQKVDGCRRMCGYGYNNRPVALIRRFFGEFEKLDIGVVWNKYTTSYISSKTSVLMHYFVTMRRWFCVCFSLL